MPIKSGTKPKTSGQLKTASSAKKAQKQKPAERGRAPKAGVAKGSDNKPADKKPRREAVRLDAGTKAWVAAVNELGKLPRGCDPRDMPPMERVKALFKTNKRSIFELWEVYTQRRDELSRRLINNRAYTLSYLLGFHLANVARASDLLTRSNKRHLWNKSCASAPVRLYDIGCGTGAMSMAYLQAAKASEVFLYDASGPLLDAAKAVHQHFGTKSLKTSRTEIEDLKLEWFKADNSETIHVYMLGYVWNELERNNPAKRRLMQIFMGHIARDEKALLFIAEPAIEHMSRATMELRDIICDAGYQALYPCPTSLPCPMLPRPKDWCYSEGLWEQPEIAAWIDEKLDLDRRRHAGSMYAFASPALKLTSDGTHMVVGRPTKETGIERFKGHFDYLVCVGDDLRKKAPLFPKQILLRGEPYEEKKQSPGDNNWGQTPFK